MKRQYLTPIAEMIIFDYAETVVASGKNPAQCTGHNPGHGCGKPHEVTVDSVPGHCSQDQERKNANKGCF